MSGAGRPDGELRRRLADQMDARSAHVDLARAIEGLPRELRGRRPEGFPHSPWEILEHLRLAQEDILEYSRNPDWVSPEWPEGYWPPSPEPPDEAAWEASVAAFRRDLAAMRALVADPANDLLAPFAWAAEGADGANLLREALLVGDHNAYHLGQLVDVRRLLGAWPPA